MIPWEVIHLSGLLFLYPQNSTNDICILPRPGVKWIYSIRTLWSSLRMNTVVNTKHANRKGYGRTWESHRGTLQEHNIGFLSESRMLVAGFVLLQMLRGAVKWAKRDRWCLTPECDLSHVRWLHGCRNTLPYPSDFASPVASMPFPPLYFKLNDKNLHKLSLSKHLGRSCPSSLFYESDLVL